jgi:hypothetical protein
MNQLISLLAWPLQIQNLQNKRKQEKNLPNSLVQCQACLRDLVFIKSKNQFSINQQTHLAYQSEKCLHLKNLKKVCLQE